jgi:hypothetical protein
MIDPQHLLAVARELANLDPRRPRQASLRRAVSTAYYSMFHLLIHESVSACVGFGPSTTHREIGETVARWFTHTRMAEVCAQFAGPTAKSKLRQALPKGAGGVGGAASVAASTALQAVARTFLNLQQARHDADYDLSKGFTRQGTLTLVDQAEQAFNDWTAAGADPFRPIFLLMLLTGDSVIKER